MKVSIPCSSIFSPCVYAPNRAHDTTVVDRLRDLESIRDLTLRARRNRLLNEERYAGEVLDDLEFNITAGLCAATEHGWRADNECMKALLCGPPLDELIKRLVDARVLVCGDDKRVALLLQHGLCTLDGRVNQCNDLEPRAELAVGVIVVRCI